MRGSEIHNRAIAKDASWAWIPRGPAIFAEPIHIVWMQVISSNMAHFTRAFHLASGGADRTEKARIG